MIQKHCISIVFVHSSSSNCIIIVIIMIVSNKYEFLVTCLHLPSTCMYTHHNNDRSSGFCKDQLKGKQLLPTFSPDALVAFRAKVLKMKPL